MYPAPIPDAHTQTLLTEATHGPAAPEQDLCWSLRPGTGSLGSSAAPRLPHLVQLGVERARGRVGNALSRTKAVLAALGRARKAELAALQPPQRRSIYLTMAAPSPSGGGGPAAAPGAAAAPRAPRGLRRQPQRRQHAG